MVDVEKQRNVRLRIMQAIYEISGGSASWIVPEADLKELLKISASEMSNALEYLQGEALIVVKKVMHPATKVVLKPDSSGLVPSRHNPLKVHSFYQGPWVETRIMITHRGVKELEQSPEVPSEPTQHFPSAISVIYVRGNVIGSAIQSGSPGAQQEVSVGQLDLDAVRGFLHEFDVRVADLGLSSSAVEELSAEIDTVKAQLRLRTPKLHVVREGLISARVILQAVTGSSAAAGLLELLERVRL